LQGVEAALKAAYDIHKATTFDEGALREQIREELLAEAAGGVRVEGVTPKRGAASPSSNENVDDMSTKDRLAYYAEKYPDLE
jgi:hypothetical protein